MNDSVEGGTSLVRASVVMLVAVPIGVVFLTVWAVIVDTSPTLNPEERIRGWGTVVRELPATALLISVPLVGFVLAVMAGRRGSVERARRAISFHGIALFFVLLVIMNGSAENIMTTRPSTVKWLLLPLQIGITLLAVVAARRSVSRDVGSSSLIAKKRH